VEVDPLVMSGGGRECWRRRGVRRRGLNGTEDGFAVKTENNKVEKK